MFKCNIKNQSAMKTLSNLLILMIFVTSCAPMSQIGSSDKDKNIKTKFTEKQIPVLTNNVKENFTQINFNNHSNSFITRQVMFDNFNRWNEAQITEDAELEELLIWKNVALIDGINEKFTVIASGTGKNKAVVNTILVYDEKGKDALLDDSIYKNDIINFFTKEIATANQESDFYESYLTAYYPETWDYLVENQTNSVKYKNSNGHPTRYNRCQGASYSFLSSNRFNNCYNN